MGLHPLDSPQQAALVGGEDGGAAAQALIRCIVLVASGPFRNKNLG